MITGTLERHNAKKAGSGKRLKAFDETCVSNVQVEAELGGQRSVKQATRKIICGGLLGVSRGRLRLGHQGIH